MLQHGFKTNEFSNRFLVSGWTSQWTHLICEIEFSKLWGHLCETFCRHAIPGSISPPNSSYHRSFKNYSGWEFSNIRTVDQAVRNNIWTLVDEIIGTTMHRESRDTIIPITRYDRDEQEKLDTREDQDEWKNVVEKLKQKNWYRFPFLSSFPSSDENLI